MTTHTVVFLTAELIHSAESVLFCMFKPKSFNHLKSNPLIKH